MLNPHKIEVVLTQTKCVYYWFAKICWFGYLKDLSIWHGGQTWIDSFLMICGGSTVTEGKHLNFQMQFPSCFKKGFVREYMGGVYIWKLMLLMIISRILIKIPQNTATWTLTFLDSWTMMFFNSHPSTPWRLPFSVLCHQSCHAVAPCGSCRTTRLQTLGTCLGGIKGGIDCDLEGYGYCFLRVILSDSWQHLIFK